MALLGSRHGNDQPLPPDWRLQLDHLALEYGVDGMDRMAVDGRGGSAARAEARR